MLCLKAILAPMLVAVLYDNCSVFDVQRVIRLRFQSVHNSLQTWKLNPSNYQKQFKGKTFIFQVNSYLFYKECFTIYKITYQINVHLYNVRCKIFLFTPVDHYNNNKYTQSLSLGIHFKFSFCFGSSNKKNKSRLAI